MDDIKTGRVFAKGSDRREFVALHPAKQGLRGTSAWVELRRPSDGMRARCSTPQAWERWVGTAPLEN
jgi:hypothetical protein